MSNTARGNASKSECPAQEATRLPKTGKPQPHNLHKTASKDLIWEGGGPKMAFRGPIFVRKYVGGWILGLNLYTSFAKEHQMCYKGQLFETI